jgi:hypothetical protein
VDDDELALEIKRRLEVDRQYAEHCDPEQSTALRRSGRPVLEPVVDVRGRSVRQWKTTARRTPESRFDKGSPRSSLATKAEVLTGPVRTPTLLFTL